VVHIVVHDGIVAVMAAASAFIASTELSSLFNA
jgi:hypothetical protein